MRDKKYCQAKLIAKLVEKVDYLRLNRYVECGNGLVGNDHIGIHNYRTCYTDSLSLTAGELVRITSCVLTHEAYELKYFIYLFLNVLLILDSVYNEALGDYLLNCHTRIKRCYGILEYHLDLCDELGLFSDTKIVAICLLGFLLSTLLFVIDNCDYL